MALQIKDKRYTLGTDIDVLSLIDKYGCPIYVYETETIKRQYDKFIQSFDLPRLQINYACKALTNLSILKYIRSLGAGLDTVSIQEVKMGLKAGFEPEQILYTPNCVSIEEISKAVKLNVNINIDNISILEQFGQSFPEVPVCVRINPHIMAGGNSKISTGHIDSKFGISIHQVPLVKRVVEATGLKVCGLHMHTGSEILDTGVFLQGAEILFGIAEEFKDLDYIDMGSGFKVSYKNDGIETDMGDLGKELSIRFKEFCKNYGKDLTLVFEPGKYLVSESGFFFSKVNVVKQTTSTVFAGIDSGMNHLIRPMLYDAYHTVTNISKTEGRDRIYTIVGYICETDTFGVNRKLKEINEGDVLAFHNAGAYCFSMASNYNSRYRPAEILIHEGVDYLIRKRECFEDLLSNQIEVNF